MTREDEPKKEYWINSKFTEIDMITKLLNLYDEQIRHLDYLHMNTESIEHFISEKLDEFPDGYDVDIKKCLDIIESLKQRILVEIGQRISGMYTIHWERNIIDSLDKF